jgi:hypothetical protein
VKMRSIIGNGEELAKQVIAKPGIILGHCFRIRAMQVIWDVLDNGLAFYWLGRLRHELHKHPKMPSASEGRVEFLVGLLQRVESVSSHHVQKRDGRSVDVFGPLPAHVCQMQL